MAISNKYKDIFDELIDSSKAKFLKAIKSENALTNAKSELERDYLN